MVDLETEAPAETAVIIAGGGPCGLMLANELGRRGIATLLFDEKPSTSPHPQANATQARTMEHFRRLGFADAVRSAGLPRDYPTDVAYFTRLGGYELARFELPAAGRASELARQLSGSWSAAELPHRCSQMFVERILRSEAERLPSVTLRYGWRVTGFTASQDHVEVEAVELSGGSTQRFRAPYLVGCDGPRSPTRRQLGIPLAGESGAARDFMGGRMHAIYLRAPTLYGMMPARRAWQYWSVNRDRRAILIALDGKSEFVFHAQLKPEEQGEISDAKACALLEEALGQPCPIEIISRLSWTAGFTLVAEKFGRGRVLLGGDAVHLFTPTGELGYNTAVEDAVNLGWKLAAVLQGWGGPDLLRSYELERQPVARRNTGYARRFADSVGGFVPASEIEDDTPAGAAARHAAGDHLNAHARAEFNIPGITFGGRYDGSPIVVPDGTEPPVDAINVYVPTACPGGRAPHAWLADGRSLFDSFGFEFTLLRLGPNAPDPRPFLAAASSRDMPLALVEHSSPELRELYAADLAIIRPDQVVAWRGDRVPDDPDRILSRITGHDTP